MKRVQIILEEWQQQWLSEEAKRQHVSMSALLRQMLTEVIERRRAESWEDDPLWGIVGLAEGPDDGITSENHCKRELPPHIPKFTAPDER